MASKIILIRHGDTGLKYRGRFIGSTDVSLSTEGVHQSSLLAGFLRKETAVTYITSPSRRTRETAEKALAWTTIEPERDPQIREVDFGVWEGKTFDEINASNPEAVAAWAAFKPDFAFPGGERITDFMERVRRTGRRIADDPAETVALFTHGGVIRALICHYLALEMRNHLYFEVKHASLTTIMVHNGRGVLTGLNDLCHLEDSRHG